ncbi:MAG TPA: methylated-DNA--[protein]-cysteine S-methyltransferase [Opitutaceae bacterium]|nr:methylated-DNA--[protein]-cysteine S-methyltransferase [Opitutaceae bacterium]
MNFFYDTFSTPFGVFSAAVDNSGALAATAFGDVCALASRLKMPELSPSHARLAPVRKQIEAYFAGEQQAFRLTLASNGSVFQQRVWTALQQIRFGETRSYAALARALRSSPRAVGRANATNPICLVVPCHRVIGADGSLTGFAFGEDIKRRLLEHERGVALGSRAA